MNLLQTIPLDNLNLSARNVRKTLPENTQSLDQLAASIQHQGLLQNLLVIPDPDKADHFAVIGGGRRFMALKQLVENDALPESLKNGIPCHLYSNTEEAEAISLAENYHRENMHPIDEYEAFATMIQQGMSVKAIATSFGLSDRHVRQRLKLASVHPDLLNACREEKINLRELMAFTICDNREKQLEVWEHIQEDHFSEYTIKSLLTEDKIPNTDKRVTFIGLDTYIAAGGNVTTDLFSDTCYLHDVVLLESLCQGKLEELKAEFVCRNLAWVKASVSLNRDDDIYAQRVWYEPAEEDCPDYGCWLTVGYSGDVDENYFRIVSDDDSEADEIESPDDVTITENPPASPYSNALQIDLKTVRQAILQLNVLNDFEATFDWIVYQWACLTMSRWGYMSASALEAEGLATTVQEKFLDAYDQLDVSWHDKDSLDNFQAFSGLAPEAKQAWFVWCVARQIDREMSADHVTLGERLNIHVRDHWQPDSTFLKRVSKEQCLDIGGAIMGENWRNTRAKKPKSDLVAGVESILHGNYANMTEEQIETALHWVPQGLAFASQS